MEQTIDVDNIWRSLGPWGKYQLGQLVMMWVAMIPCSMHTLSTIFIGFRPPYQCQEVNYTQFKIDLNSTAEDNLVVNYDKCHISYYVNNSDINETTSKTLGCINGYQYDTHKDISFVAEWDLVCSGSEWAEVSQALVMLGQGVGGLLFTIMSDKFGRKPIHLFCHICLLVITLATAFVPTYTSFAALRFVTGALIEGLLLTSVTQYTETLPEEWRFCSEVMGVVSWTTGIVLLTPFGYFMRNLSWRYIQIALALLSSYSLVEYWLFDESLRWLMANGKLEDAEQVVKKAARRNNMRFDDVIKRAKEKSKKDEEEALSNANEERQKKAVVKHIEMQLKQPEQSCGSIENVHDNDLELDPVLDSTMQKYAVKKYSVITIIKHRIIFLNSVIIWICWITDNLIYYGLSLISASLSGNRFLNHFLMSVVEYLSAFVEFLLLNRIGRKPTLIMFFIVSGVCLLLATLLTTFADDNKTMASFSTVFAVVGKFGIMGTFSSIFLLSAEVYPTNLRNAGYGVASTASKIGGVIAPFCATLAERVRWGPGAIFTGLCVFTTILISFLPETMGHELPTTIEELKTWYKDHSGFKISISKKKKRNSEYE